ncbi:MAG: RHS repeat-associated core domain-containing protein [Terriglobia bacterium]
MTLMTLDPTRGFMVPYGTGTVSGDGMRIIADADPAHPGHAYGLVHFDWHGPTPPSPPGQNPNPGGPGDPGGGDGGGNGGGGGSGGDGDGNGNNGGNPTGTPPGGCNTCPCSTPAPSTSGDPIDIGSGLVVRRSTDIAVKGPRGSISIVRTYRTMSGNPGPFGIGTGFNYGYQLDTLNYFRGGGVIQFATPDGNQFPFNLQSNGSLINTTVPSLVGAVMAPASGGYNLRWKNGTVWQFQSVGPGIAFLTSVTDSNGNVISIAVNPAVLGQVTRVTDPVGRSLTLNYDSFNRVTSIVDPIGRTVQYAYNSQGTLASVTDPAGGVSTFTYDPQNNQELTKVTDARGVVVAQNTYDSYGRLIQQVAADGGVRTFTYGLLNPIAVVSPVLNTVVTDPIKNQTNYRFGPTGFLTDATDPTGETKSLIRDQVHSGAIARYIGRAYCNGCGPSPARGDTLTYTYDSNGNVLTSTDALGNVTIFTYDPTFNKVTSITNPLGKVTTFSYDSSGNLLARTDANGHTTSFGYNSFGQVTQITDPLAQKTTFSYDGFGNLISTTDPLGNTTAIVYDGLSRPIATADPLGRTSTTAYDALGRIVKQTNAQGKSTQFTYDAVGNLLSVTDANGNQTAFTYDGMNRLLTRIDPLGHTDTRAYDFNGNLTQFTDRRGQVSTFIYDNLNRLTGESYQDGGRVSRFYDASGHLQGVFDSQVAAYGGGPLPAIVVPGFLYAYDAAGHLTNSFTRFGSISYSYDAAGRVTSRQVAGQDSLTYSYDDAGNLVSAALPQASASFTYDMRNLLASIARANGVGSQYSYDNAGRLLSIADSGGQGISNSQSYTYDPVGNRTVHSTNIAQPLITQAVGNTYDNANRLISSTAASGTTTFTYDANGNLASAAGPNGITTYTWDGRNRLQSIAAPGQRTTFTYDFAGNLIAQSDNGASLNLTKTFVLDGLTNLAYVSQNSGDNLSVLAGRGVDQHLAVVHSGGQVEYGLADAINSTVATTDQSGKTLTSFFYEPFGQTTTSSPYLFQYTGRVPTVGGLYSYRARYYNADSARFASEDPLMPLARNVNLYRYAFNNPVVFVDPVGTQAAGTGGFATVSSTYTVDISAPTQNAPFQPLPTFQLQPLTINQILQPPTISLPTVSPPSEGPNLWPAPVYTGPSPEQFQQMVDCLPGEICNASGQQFPHAGENPGPNEICPVP